MKDKKKLIQKVINKQILATADECLTKKIKFHLKDKSNIPNDKGHTQIIEGVRYVKTIHSDTKLKIYLIALREYLMERNDEIFGSSEFKALIKKHPIKYSIYGKALKDMPNLLNNLIDHGFMFVHDELQDKRGNNNIVKEFTRKLP